MSELPIKRSETIGALVGALALAQQSFTEIQKNRENTYNHTWYADLADVIAATRPSLAQNGLAIIQVPIYGLEDRKLAGAFSMLAHSSGEFISTELVLPAEGKAKEGALKLDAQTIAAAITYAKRYSWQALVGVAAEEDDDAVSVADKTDTRSTPSKPQTVKAPPVSQKVSNQGGERPNDSKLPPSLPSGHFNTPTPSIAAPPANDIAPTVPEQGSIVPKADINNPIPELSRVESTSSQNEQADIPADKLKSSEKPTKAQFDAYTARAVALKVPLEKAGLKPSKGLQTGAKLKKYLLEVAGAKELTDLAIYQWEDFFILTEPFIQTDPVRLVNLIEGGKAA